MDKDYKDKLTFTAPTEKKKNLLEVWMEWDSNDADYIERTTTMSPKCLFEDQKLIYCLAYISLPYDFIKEGADWNGSRFCHHIDENDDIEDLADILDECDFAVHSDWGMCHTCSDMRITYYDENGQAFLVTFDKIIDEFSKMTYEEICDKINSIEWEGPVYDEDWEDWEECEDDEDDEEEPEEDEENVYDFVSSFEGDTRLEEAVQWLLDNEEEHYGHFTLKKVPDDEIECYDWNEDEQEVVDQKDSFTDLYVLYDSIGEFEQPLGVVLY